MDAREYLKKTMKICEAYDAEGKCEECPLRKKGCGIPRNADEIEELIGIMETHQIKTDRKCRCCRKLLNELPGGIEYCPWCGEPVKGEKSGKGN